MEYTAAKSHEEQYNLSRKKRKNEDSTVNRDSIREQIFAKGILQSPPLSIIQFILAIFDHHFPLYVRYCKTQAKVIILGNILLGRISRINIPDNIPPLGAC